VPETGLHAEGKVLGDAQAIEQRRDLESTGESLAGTPIHRPVGDVPVVEAYGAAVGGDLTGELVDDRGLAGPVGPDEGVNLTPAHMQ
jgi:hypothetical protein